MSRYIAVLCENVAAEHGSRMTAMENATKNAEEVGKNLELKIQQIKTKLYHNRID